MPSLQTLFNTVQCSDQFKQFSSLFGNMSELENLQNTLKTICAVLENAEANHDALSRQKRLFVEVRDAVYDADDVLDEFFTLFRHKKLILDGGEVCSKVKSFLYKFERVSLSLSKKVKKFRRKLDAIATETTQFGFKIDYRPIRFKKEDSCSYVFSDDVTGRQTDLDNIVGMLLDSAVESDISFLTVVGIGGLGKTALAQLVYNDPRITGAFPLRVWICVADEGQDWLDAGEILCKILASATDHRIDGYMTMDGVQSQLNYLLVLDDVWNENGLEWMELAGFLKGGAKGI